MWSDGAAGIAEKRWVVRKELILQKILIFFIRQISVHPRPIPLFVFILCGLYFIMLVATAGDIGWTWDEVYYFLSSQKQLQWFKTLFSSASISDLTYVFSRGFVDEHWLWSPEQNPHPPLYKILSGLCWWFFSDTLGDFTAYRLSSALLSIILIFFLFRAIEKNRGFIPAICGSLTLLLMPRFFGHSHIAATEIPLASFWFMTCYFFYKGLTGSQKVPITPSPLTGEGWGEGDIKTNHSALQNIIRFTFWGKVRKNRFVATFTRLSCNWSVLTAGIVLGFAFAVKFTAILIPIPLVLWAIIYREKKAFLIIAIMLIIAPVIAFSVNPGWWHSPVDKIYEFVYQSLSRKENIPISTYFIGTKWSFSPPWFYAPVMLLITIPLTALLVMVAGLLSLVKEKFCSSSDVLYLLNIPVIMGVVMLPGTPVHDGVRQFFYVLPFLAYLSGPGYGFIINSIRSLDGSSKIKNIAVALCLFILLFSQAWQLKKYHPFYLSYYNELIGGLKGAYNRGMEITYWFDACDNNFIAYINKQIPAQSKIGVFPPNIDYFIFLQYIGKIKDDVFFCTPVELSLKEDDNTNEFTDSSEYFILMSRLEGFREFQWVIYNNVEPLYSTKVDGVQLMGIYEW